MRKVTKMWKMKDGKKIRICDMTDKHLLNTIKFLERKATEIKLSVPFPMFHGEMAQWTAEQEYDHIQEADEEEFFPIIVDLCTERDRRGIE